MAMLNWKKLLPALLASVIGLGACAADSGQPVNPAGAAAASVPPAAAGTQTAPTASATVPAVIRATLLKYAPGLQIDQITPAPMPGWYQVVAGGQLGYVSADGRYLMHGNLIDLVAHRTLSDNAWAAFRRAELAKLPAADRIVFAPPHPKYRITVFTDVTCPYCRAMHEQIAAYNRAGIEVDYLAWPREGVVDASGTPTRTYTEMVAVWCASDRRQAFTEAMQGRAPKAAQCANPVRAEFDLGQRLGVGGTPAVIAEDGSIVGGYVPPDKLIEVLKDPAKYRLPDDS